MEAPNDDEDDEDDEDDNDDDNNERFHLHADAAARSKDHPSVGLDTTFHHVIVVHQNTVRFN
jgi:uncharacterized heparinase superfamily protein